MSVPTISYSYVTGGGTTATGNDIVFMPVGTGDTGTVTITYNLRSWRDLTIWVDASVGNPVTITVGGNALSSITSAGTTTITQPPGISQIVISRTGADIRVAGLSGNDMTSSEIINASFSNDEPAGPPL